MVIHGISAAEGEQQYSPTDTAQDGEYTRMAETNVEMAQKQSEMKELMKHMTEIAELRLQLEDMSNESTPGIRDQLEQKLQDVAKMRTEKRHDVDVLMQTIDANQERMRQLTAWGDTTVDDRAIIQRIEEENSALDALAGTKAKEIEPYVKGSLYKKDDFVKVARTQRDVHGKPFGYTDPEHGWVVVDATDPNRIAVQGMEKEKGLDGTEEFPSKIVDATTLERWNAA